MTLGEYLHAVRRSWAVILLLGAIGACGGYIYASYQPVIYQGSATVLVSAEGAGSVSELNSGSSYVEQVVTSYAELARSELVLDPVIDELGLDTTARGLSDAVATDSPLDTLLINIRVSLSDPERAASVANAVADQLGETVAEVSPSVAGQSAVLVTTIQSASVPGGPVAPSTRLYVVVLAVLGLALGVVIAVVRRLLGGRVHETADVASLNTSTPVVGEIVTARTAATVPASVLKEPRSAEAESVRRLAANLTYLGVDGGLRSMMITSAQPGEGKSSIATAMALIVAENAERVLLVDADLRAPALHTYTGLDNTIGLSSVLVGEVPAEIAAQQWGSPGLSVLTSGPIPPNPGQMLTSEGLRKLLAEASASYDAVIVDTGPLLAVSDPVWLGHLVDGIFVVVRRRRTKVRVLGRALEALAAAHTPATGVIITRAKSGRSSAYTYGYGRERRRRLFG